MNLELGNRVTIRNLLGNIRFIGRTSFADGIWIGIELDEEQGKNDGSVDGVRYFALSDGRKGMYGIFSRPEGVQKVSQRCQFPLMKSESGMDSSLREDEHLFQSNSKSVSTESGKTDARLRRITGKLQDKLRTMNEKCKALECELTLRSQEQTRLAQLEEQLENMILEKENAEQSNDLLMEQLEELAESHEKLLNELKDYKEEVALRRKVDLNIIHDNLEVSNPEKLLRDNELLRIATIKLHDDLDRSRELCAKLQEENASLNESAANYITQINSLERELEMTLQSLHFLKKDAYDEKNLSEIVEKLSTENAQLNIELEQLKAELKQLEKAKANDEKYNEELIQLQKDIEDELNVQIENLKKEILVDQASIQKLKSENWSLTQELTRKPDDSLNKDVALLETMKLREHALMTENEALKIDFDLLSSKLELCEIDDRIDALANIRVLLKKDCTIKQNVMDLCKTRLILLYWYWNLKTIPSLECSFSEINFIDAIETLKRNRPLLLQPTLLARSTLTSCDPRALYSPLLEFLRKTSELYLHDFQMNNPGQKEIIPSLYCAFQEFESKLSQRLENYDEFGNRCTTEANTKKLLYNFIDALQQNPLDETKILDVIQAILSIEINILPLDEKRPELPPTENTEEYTEIIANLEGQIKSKEVEIDELHAKIDVLAAKMIRNEESESTISFLKSELFNAKETIKLLKEEASEMSFNHSKALQEIEKFKSEKIALVETKSFKEILREKERCEKLDLISEISDLRHFLRLDSSKDNFEWNMPPLERNISFQTPVTVKHFNTLGNILEGMLALIDQSTEKMGQPYQRVVNLKIIETHEFAKSFLHNITTKPHSEDLNS